jgi:hypothetical protein
MIVPLQAFSSYFLCAFFNRLIIVVPLDSLSDFHIHRLLDNIFQVRNVRHVFHKKYNTQISTMGTYKLEYKASH